jgi:hypothetical protein
LQKLLPAALSFCSAYLCHISAGSAKDNIKVLSFHHQLLRSLNISQKFGHTGIMNIAYLLNST